MVATCPPVVPTPAVAVAVPTGSQLRNMGTSCVVPHLVGVGPVVATCGYSFYNDVSIPFCPPLVPLASLSARPGSGAWPRSFPSPIVW